MSKPSHTIEPGDVSESDIALAERNEAALQAAGLLDDRPAKTRPARKTPPAGEPMAATWGKPGRDKAA